MEFCVTWRRLRHHILHFDGSCVSEYELLDILHSLISGSLAFAVCSCFLNIYISVSCSTIFCCSFEKSVLLCMLMERGGISSWILRQACACCSLGAVQ